MKKLIYYDYENNICLELTTIPQAMGALRYMPIGERLVVEGGGWFYITVVEYKGMRAYAVMEVGDYEVGCDDCLIDCFINPREALELYGLSDAKKIAWETTWKDIDNIEWK